MTTRLRFVLDGDDHLSPVLTHAGDSSARLHRRLNDDFDGNARAVRAFTQDADGRLRDLRGRFISAADAQRLMGDGMPGLTRRLSDVSSAGGDAASSLGQSGGGLSGVMIGLAVVAGMTLLPAIGALVPMMAGAALAAGTLQLGFSGVADAVEQAGKNKKKYEEALKKMGPEQREFTKALVDTKKEFSGVGKEVQKAMLPGFTKALKDAEPVVKIVSKAMVEMGGAFGDAAEGVGQLLKDSGFQDSLQKNLKLGAGFVRDMTSAMGPFVRSLLDFGAASGPTLKAFSDGIGGLLTKGLPGFFDGLQTGIGGAAKMLDGLFTALNDILPGIGRLAGEMGNTLGPVFGEAFKTSGNVITGTLDGIRIVMEKMRPVFKDIAFGFKDIRDLGALVGPTMIDTGKAIMGAFSGVGPEANKAAGPLQRLNGWIADNKIGILEASRVFGNAMIDISEAAIQAAPTVIKAFKFVSIGVLDSIDVAVSAAAKLWGWVPGIGPKLKAANKAFDDFKGGYIRTLDAAERKATDFAASSARNLAPRQLKMNIDNWNAQIAAAQAKLKTVPPSRQAALRANIRDLQNKVAEATRQMNNLDGKTATTWIYTNYATPHHIATGGLVLRAMGGPVRRFPAGGPVSGPGSSTSDSIPAMISNGEYVINAASTRKYLRLIEAINDDRLGGGGRTASVVAARPAVAGRPAVAAGRGATVINNYVTVQAGPTSDRIGIAKEVQTLLKELKRNNGGEDLGLS